MTRFIRPLPNFILMFVWALAAAASPAQTVDDLKLLPPIGSSTGDASMTAELLEPDTAVEVAADPPTADVPNWIPHRWFTGPVWNYGAELGINGSEGNAQAFSILAGANAKRETDSNTLEWNLKYGKSQTGGIETQHFALFNSRWDWKMSANWLLYNKNTLEYDEFKAFDLRVAVSGGWGYHLIQTDVTKLTGRFGAGASREFGGPDNDWVPEANMGIDFERQLTARQRVKLTTDYYPSWEAFEDYRLVTDAFWEIQLDQASGLSFKIGAIDRYDSTPNGAVSNDIDYFATLIWSR